MAGEDPEEEAEEAHIEDEKCYEAAEVLFFNSHDCHHCAGIFIHIYSMHL